MLCRSCQKDVPENALYCPQCGAVQGPTPRKLFRSRREQKLLGVCGGFAEYWQVDPTLVRALYLVLTFLTGILPGLLLYIALALLMPAQESPS